MILNTSLPTIAISDDFELADDSTFAAPACRVISTYIATRSSARNGALQSRRMAPFAALRPLALSSTTLEITRNGQYTAWKCFPVADQIEYVTFDVLTTVMMVLRMIGSLLAARIESRSKSQSLSVWKKRNERMTRAVFSRDHLQSSSDIGEAIAA